MSHASKAQRNTKKPNMNEILEAAEAGSVQHLRTLRTGWPQDFEQAKRALTIILGHLKPSNLPDLDHRPVTTKDDAHKVVVVRTSLAVLEVVLSTDYTKKLGTAKSSQMLSILDDHLGDFLATLEIAARHPIIVDEGFDQKSGQHIGIGLGANYALRIIDVGLQYFQKDKEGHSLNSLVDFVLKNWLRGAKRVALNRPPVSEYRYIDMIIDSFRAIVQEGTAELLTASKIASFGQRKMRQLAQSFNFYCSEWKAVHLPAYNASPRRLDCHELITLVTVAQSLASDTPLFSRALWQSGFHTLALRVGLDFRNSSYPHDEKGAQSVLTHVAVRVFFSNILRATDAVHVLPDLLRSKLLQIIVNDAIKNRGQGSRFWLGKNPVLFLGRISHHPKVFAALAEASCEVPENTWNNIWDDPALTKLFEPLSAAGELQETIDDRMEDLANPLRCDCLEHHAIGLKAPPKILQCSQCRAVTYCSRRCQQADWDALHRAECSRNRINRIDCQMESIWLSHKNRVRYLYTLDVALRSVLKTPKHVFNIPETASKTSNPIFVANALQMPMSLSACASVEDFFLVTGRNFLDGWAEDVPLFSNDRFRAIVWMAENNLDVQLVAYLSMVGMHWIVALAAFDLRHQSKTSKGKDLRLMLAGHVKILSLPLQDHRPVPRNHAARPSKLRKPTSPSYLRPNYNCFLAALPMLSDHPLFWSRSRLSMHASHYPRVILLEIYDYRW